MATDIILIAAFALGFFAIGYLYLRNEWVYRKRAQLGYWHFLVKGDTSEFNGRYGSYQDWLYGWWWCWDAAKIAGLEQWPSIVSAASNDGGIHDRK